MRSRFPGVPETESIAIRNAVFNGALNAAKAVYKKADAAQVEINNAKQRLEAAIKGLRYFVNIPLR